MNKAKDEVEVEVEVAADGGGSSPRTRIVADRLRCLAIETPAPSPTPEDNQPDRIPKKRLKSGGAEDAVHVPHRDVENNPATPLQDVTGFKRKAKLQEIGETPDCYARYPSSPPLSPLPKRPSGLSPTKPSIVKAAHARMVSPPPPTPITSPPEPNMDLTANAVPLARSPGESGGPKNATALTWQESEITGHEIDTTGGDDGEGINGIGFKPTPAMAYARSQRRKQQVSEWRAREAREARQRRMEKRRGGSGDFRGARDRAEESKRVVRFAEASQ